MKSSMRNYDFLNKIPSCFEKRNTKLEVCLPLFDTCNLNCKFCYEKHGHVQLKRGAFPKALEDIKRFILPRIKECDYKDMDLRFYGGELFYDAQPDWMFSAYEDLIDAARKMIPIPIHTKFITNGVFTKQNRVIELINKTSSNIGMSYDAVGRYHNEQEKSMFLKNMHTFIDMGVLNEIASILMKPCIDAYIAGDTVFDSIPQNVRIDTDFYIPTQTWKTFMSTSEDYYRFFEWGIKNQRFNIDYIEMLVVFMIQEERKTLPKVCSCSDTLTYIPDQRIFSGECIECREFSKKYYGDFATRVNESNSFAVKTNMMLTKCGCMYCEYFNDCPMQCAASVLFDEYKQVICPMKKAFQCITQQDIENYKTWRKIYRGKDAKKRA